MPQATGSGQPRASTKKRRTVVGSTVRVREHTHSTLQALSNEMNEPIQDIVEEAVEAFRRQRLLELHNQAYAALRADPERWRQELEERAVWETANADGLEGE